MSRVIGQATSLAHRRGECAVGVSLAESRRPVKCARDRREPACGAVRPSPVLFRRPTTRSTINGVITQAPQPSRSHRRSPEIRPLAKALLTAVAALVLALIPAIAVPALLGTASPRHSKRPTPTVTVKVSVPVRKPAETVTVTRPGPTITATVLQPGPTVTIRCHNHGRGCGQGDGQ